MSKSTRRTLLTAVAVLLTALFFAPSLASAQYREFTGKIDMLSQKKKKFIVDNRKGDKVPFEFIETTEVSGEKTQVKKLKKGDWVTVSWKMMDKPARPTRSS
jgi:hypothetical protein